MSSVWGISDEHNTLGNTSCCQVQVMLHNLYCQIFLTKIIPIQNHISLYGYYLMQEDGIINQPLNLDSCN